MATKIGELKGFEMLYDPHSKRFLAINTEGEEVAAGKTQEELEGQIDKLAKQKFTFPIRAIRNRGVGYIDEGRVTSLNISERSVWFCKDKKEGEYSDRGKVRLRYDRNLFELTDQNAKIMSEIRELLNSIKELEEKIQQKGELLEKPINLEYFGLENRY